MTSTVGMTPAPSNEIIGHGVGSLGHVMGHRRSIAEVSHPVHATRVLCEVANERGVPTSDVLAGTSIYPSDLDKPDTMVSAADEIMAVRQLLARLPDHAGIGVDVGSRSTLTHLGLFGFAVMSCGTLRELFSIAMRYFALTTMHIRLTLRNRRGLCHRTRRRPPARGCAGILHRT